MSLENTIQSHWIATYRSLNAFWKHPGGTTPHALLTSGLHSDGFANSHLIMRHPQLAEGAGADLLRLLEWRIPDVECVVGPAMGAILLASYVALAIRNAHKHNCVSEWVEKDPDNPHVMKLTRGSLDGRVLLVEDVLTTGVSSLAALAGVRDAGGRYAPFIGALVNRSGRTHVGGLEIVALIDVPMQTWEPEECPLCKAGSEAIRPKGTENWRRLNSG